MTSREPTIIANHGIVGKLNGKQQVMFHTSIHIANELEQGLSPAWEEGLKPLQTNGHK